MENKLIGRIKLNSAVIAKLLSLVKQKILLETKNYELENYPKRLYEKAKIKFDEFLKIKGINVNFSTYRLYHLYLASLKSKEIRINNELLDDKYTFLDLLAMFIGYKNFKNFLCSGLIKKEIAIKQFEYIDLEVPEDCKFSDSKKKIWLEGIYDFFYINMPLDDYVVYKGKSKLYYDDTGNLQLEIKGLSHYKLVNKESLYLEHYNFYAIMQFPDSHEKFIVSCYFGSKPRTKTPIVLIGSYTLLGDNYPNIWSLPFVMIKKTNDKNLEIKDEQVEIVKVFEEMSLKSKVSPLDFYISIWLLNKVYTKEYVNIERFHTQLKNNLERILKIKNKFPLIRSFYFYYRNVNNRLTKALMLVLGNWLLAEIRFPRSIIYRGVIREFSDVYVLEISASMYPAFIYIPKFISNKKSIILGSSIAKSRLTNSYNLRNIIIADKQIKNHKLLEIISLNIDKPFIVKPIVTENLISLPKYRDSFIFNSLIDTYYVLKYCTLKNKFSLTELSIFKDNYVEFKDINNIIYRGTLEIHNNSFYLKFNENGFQYLFTFSLPSDFNIILGVFNGLSFKGEPFSDKVVLLKKYFIIKNFSELKNLKLPLYLDYNSKFIANLFNKHINILKFFLGITENQKYSLGIKELNLLFKEYKNILLSNKHKSKKMKN